MGEGYKPEDMHIVPSGIEFIRTRLHRFFPDGSPSATDLANLVAREAGNFGVAASIAANGEFTTVSGTPDWIGADEDAWFQRLSPAPENGVNSIRQPVLLVALASLVATTTAASPHIRVHAGQLSQEAELVITNAAMTSDRVILFAM